MTSRQGEPLQAIASSPFQCVAMTHRRRAGAVKGLAQSRRADSARQRAREHVGAATPRILWQLAHIPCLPFSLAAVSDVTREFHGSPIRLPPCDSPILLLPLVPYSALSVPDAAASGVPRLRSAPPPCHCGTSLPMTPLCKSLKNSCLEGTAPSVLGRWLPAVSPEATERLPPTEWTSSPHKKSRPRF